ncbi:SAM-dependent methyltransferase [Actinomycetospora lutea]|uniref:SAM-dependent methyltransferase n=1 Tax=Actinomycetospora lutea TaxID=663604 RepID=UPI0023664E6C|nr:SAM-dependent methyltransferase [Actinomycetospora lutea]MDD7941533.1 SAM-dependent methyltransferase [Actinomycetospora lutea]
MDDLYPAEKIGEDDEETPPNMARVFDFNLGGTENLEVDREFAAEVDAVMPGMNALCRGHRRFSAAVVDHWCAEGIDQFLELGSGLPTVDHVHTRARRAHPGARVTYVDRDRRTVAHARRLLDGEEGVAVLHADVGDAAEVLAAPEVRDVLDLSRPVGVLAVGVLHYLHDDAAAARAVRVYADALAPGSGLAVSHLTSRARPDIHEWATMNHGGWSYAPRLREPGDMAPWLEGFTVVGPGWVSAPHWRADGEVPGPDATASGLWGVVARRVVARG